MVTSLHHSPGSTLPGGASVGSLVLRSPAYVHVISPSQLSSVCDACLATPNVVDNVPPTQLLRCSRCKQSYYCNTQCQRMAWPIHQEECKYLKRIQPRTPPSIVRLILRTAFKHRKDPDYRETLPDGTSRGLTDLKMHKEEISASAGRSEAFSNFLQVIQACVGNIFPAQVLFELYCRLLINSTEITDLMGQSLGTGLYLGLSAVDHSCDPNVNVVFTNNMVELRALSALPEWSEVRISYLTSVLPRRMRRARLEEAYYFTCQCCQCRGEEDGLCEGSLLCPTCQAPVGIQQDKCPTCGRESENDYQSGAEIFLQDNLDDCQLIKAHRLLKKKFHVYDHRMFEFSERTMAACLNEEEFKKFYEIGESLLPAYRRYFSPKSVSFGLHLAKLAKMAIYLDRREEALNYLSQSSDIFKVSHGPNSAMMSYMMCVRQTVPL